MSCCHFRFSSIFIFKSFTFSSVARLKRMWATIPTPSTNPRQHHECEQLRWDTKCCSKGIWFLHHGSIWEVFTSESVVMTCMTSSHWVDISSTVITTFHSLTLIPMSIDHCNSSACGNSVTLMSWASTLRNIYLSGAVLFLPWDGGGMGTFHLLEGRVEWAVSWGTCKGRGSRNDVLLCSRSNGHALLTYFWINTSNLISILLLSFPRGFM